MIQKARQRALQDSYATVDGIPSRCRSTRSPPALMAGIHRRLRRPPRCCPAKIKLVKLPRGGHYDHHGDRLQEDRHRVLHRIQHRVRLLSRGQARGSWNPSAERTSAVGQYVWDLPVSTEISVKGGKGIWGTPKHQAT